MKLDARQLVARILPQRNEDPPPPYTPSPSDNLPLTRSISPRRPLPTPPSEGAALARSPSAPSAPSSQHLAPPAPRPSRGVPLSDVSTSLSTTSTIASQPSYPRPQYTQSYQTHQDPTHAPRRHRTSSHHSQRPQPQSWSQPQQLSPTPSRRRSRASPAHPSPPYTPAEEERRGPASLHTLPLALVHRVLMLALDPVATPDAWNWDVEMERVRRLHWLFRDLRAVDRRFFLIATSILRDRLLPTYTSLLQVPSSNPLPPPGQADATSYSVFASRTREAAVLDRFVAMRLGEDLRRAESALCEDSGEEEVLFSRLQPAARVEDLLLRLPRSLITPPDPCPACDAAAPPQSLPLPHAHVAVTLSPLWAQLWLSYTPVNVVQARGGRGRAGRSLVVEVRRAKTPEDMVRAFGAALEGVRQGTIGWGWSFRSST